MSTENTPIDVTTDDNLDTFATEFFGESPEPSNADATATEDEETVTEVEDDAQNEEDTHSADDGAPDDEEVDETDASDDDDTEEDEKPKKANRFQERINEVTAARREAERRAEQAERDLAELRSKLEQKTDEPAPKQDKAEKNTVTDGPNPTDKNEDGTDKYPLGEFDPKFLRDTVQHMLDAEKRQQQEQEKLTAEQRKQDAQRAELQSSWNEKLVDVQERYPDFKEKGEQMLSVFEGIDPAYGQYLTDTLMEMDAGPEVFYYLSNNLDEAEQIVNAGPRKATIAFAKLEAQLAGTPTSKVEKIKTTKAPTPPPRLKGSSVSKASIPLDTDDLDAFSRELFKKKK